MWSCAAAGALQASGTDRVQLPWTVDTWAIERMVSMPTAMQWYHPWPGQPAAMLVRAAERDASGRVGPVRTHLVPRVQHTLPVASLVIPEGALFDPDTGIYVVGNAMLHGVAPKDFKYENAPVWFRYPGNFHGRGREWEREATVQFIGREGSEVHQGKVGVRIHGQMTRSFPQHALRLLFKEPVTAPLFADGTGAGSEALILRAAGNDQVKAFMRDALLQDLCKGPLLETSASSTHVVYMNGAYWGLHHLRQRMDEEELALRHGLRKKEVAIVEELKGSMVSTPQSHAEDFKRLRKRAEQWDGVDTTFLVKLEKELHVDAFLHYVAVMQVVNNKDWPGDNLRLWRRTGDAAQQDPRWYPILQDLDLAWGYQLPPQADAYQRVTGVNSPAAALFKALMRSDALRARYLKHMDELLAGPLATPRVLARIDSMEQLLLPEMERHMRRWRKPVSVAKWRAEVEVLRTFARERPGHVRRELEHLATP